MKKFLLLLFLFTSVINGQKLSSIDSAQNLKQHKIINDEIKVQSFIDSINNFKSRVKFNKNIQFIDSAISLSNKNYRFLVKALLIKSKLYWSLSKFDTAMIISDKAEKIAFKNKFENELAAVYKNVAHLYQRKGEPKNAIDFALKSLIIYEKNDDNEHSANLYSLLGVLKASLGEIDNGITYFNKSLKIHSNNNNIEKIAADFLNIGTAYFYSNRLEKAKIYFIRALNLTDRYDLSNRNALFMNLSTIYQHKKQLDSAYFYQVKAIKGAEKTKDFYMLSRLYYNASTVKFQQKDFDSTYYFAQKGLDFSIQYKRFDQQINNLLMISQVDSVRGNTKNELIIFKKIIRLKDSILEQDRKSIADEIETKYQNLKKDEIIKLQQKNLITVKDKNILLRYLVISSILLLAILFLFLMTLKKLFQKRKRLYTIEKEQMIFELKGKEKELVSLALQVEQKNVLFDRFYNKIKTFNQTKENNENQIKNILIEIKSSLNVQKDINLFSIKFEELHHNFIGELKSKYPELTIKEIKLLSFLKIGLSTKQIASIQNITPAAIHKMRYRIKKKITLSKEDSLDAFVSQL